MALDTKQPKGYRKAWNGEHRPTAGWCRDQRLKVGQDVLVEQRQGYTLVRCVGEFGPQNIHAGKWIIWGPDGHCLTIGSEAWARKRLDVVAPALSEDPHGS